MLSFSLLYIAIQLSVRVAIVLVYQFNFNTPKMLKYTDYDYSEKYSIVEKVSAIEKTKITTIHVD